jgi:RNA polymerase sigma-70 factor (ECF subfamily)
VKLTDDELVHKTTRGDAQAFGLLVERHTSVVYRIVRRMTSDRAEAEAITQDAFLRAWQALQRSGPPMAFLPWMIRIAVNAGRDMLKKSTPLDFADLPSEDVEGWAEEGGALDVAIEEGELLRRLADAVQQLPLEYRTVIALRYEAEMPYEEMADVLGLPLNTVRTRLHRAKARLKAALEGVV